jgi:hypothetical protein
MPFIEDLTRVSWQCVRFVSKREEIPTIHEFIAHKIKLFELRGDSIQSEKDLFLNVSSSMGFPDYFSSNWNALDECLQDLEQEGSDGYTLVVYDAEALWQRAPRLMGAFSESWLCAAEQWSRNGIPFHLLFIWQ